MAEFANDSIKGVEELLKVIKELKEELRSVAKVSAEVVKNITIDKATSKEIQELTKAQQTLVATTKELNKIEKQEVDLVAKLNTLRSGEQDEVLKLKAVQADLLKQKKLEAKDNAGLISQYEKKSKKLRDLKNDYKDLVLQEGKSSKATKELRKEILKLDKELVDLDNSVNDSYRNIGKYEKAIEKLEKDMLALAAAGGTVAGAFEGIKGSLEANEEGSENLRVATGRLEAVANVAKNTVATFANDMWDFGAALVNGEKSISDFGMAFYDTVVAGQNFAKNVKEQIEASDEATKSTIDLEKAQRGLFLEVERLNGIIESQNAIAGDTTKGMDSIAEATMKALVAERARNKILVEIAAEELRIIDERINATADQSQRMSLLNEQNEKQIELIGLQNELRVSEIELSKQFRENQRDQYEKALDYALDLFDTQKTLNERGIADENKTFNERVKLLERTKQLSDEAFAEQIRLSEEYTDQQLNLNELVAIDDQRVIYERISALTQDEIIQQRLLDIIRDRKTAILDLEEAERDLNQAIKERGEEDAAMNAEEAKALEDAANALTQFRMDQLEGIDNQIAAERFRADILLNNDELLADERTLIEEQFQAKVKELRDAALEEELARKAKEREEAFKIAKDITGELGSELEKRNEARIESLESEISGAEEALSRQEELASQGLDNQLAFEQERLDQLNLQRKEALEKQQRQEEAIKLAEAFISSFEARLQDDPNTALQKATQDVFLARGIAKAIAEGFAYDGIEDTGDGKGLDEKNGKLWMIHPNERIMSKKQNQLVGDLSNDELASLAYNYRMGIPVDKEKSLVVNNNAEVVNEIKSLRETIKNRPVQKVDIDKLGNIIETLDNGKMKIRTKLKTRGRL